MTTLRRAIANDATLLAEHRAAVWHEVGGWSLAELEGQVATWADFLGGHLVAETYVGRVAERDGRAVGSAGFLIHAAMPRPHLNSDRAGRVQSVYVEPDARRSGIARAMMEQLLDEARRSKLISLSLQPSDEARALYGSLGFTTANEMLLRLVD